MFAPVPLIRQNHIKKKLQRADAFSPATAVTFQEAGVLNPTWFPAVTKIMLQKGSLAQVGGRFYLCGKQ